MNTNENETKVRVLTIKQAAEKVEGLSAYRIRQLCKSGVLPCIMAGRKYLISEYVLLDFIFEHGKYSQPSEQ
jgi:hypothetical protein